MPGGDDPAVFVEAGKGDDRLAVGHARFKVGAVGLAVRVCKDVCLPILVVDAVDRDEQGVLRLLGGGGDLDGHAREQRAAVVLDLGFDGEEAGAFVRLGVDRGDDGGIVVPALLDGDLVADRKRGRRVRRGVEGDRHLVLVGDREGRGLGRRILMLVHRARLDHPVDGGIDLVLLQLLGALLEGELGGFEGVVDARLGVLEGGALREVVFFERGLVVGLRVLVAVAQAAQGAVVVVLQVVDGAARHAVGAFRLGDRRHEVLIGFA